MCSICNYEYKVKKSPFAALFLKEQAVVACATFLFLSLIVILGMLLFKYSYVLEERDLTSTLFHMMGSSEPRWRYCRVNSQKRSLLLNILLEKIYRFSVKDFPFYDLILCYETISDTFSSVILGVAALGLFGVTWSLFDESVKFYRAWGIAGRAALPDVYWSLYWVVFANDRVFAMRLGIPIGCHFVALKVRTSTWTSTSSHHFFHIYDDLFSRIIIFILSVLVNLLLLTDNVRRLIIIARHYCNVPSYT